MGEGWIYERNGDNTARFVLGTAGQNPLVCVGVNPSTAEPGDPDLTVAKVAGFAQRNGFDSWVMLNLYPQRSTDPHGMHAAFDPALKAENERRVAEFLSGRRLSLLAAWGKTIAVRPYLWQMLEGLVSVAEGCTWTSIGDLLKSGHPRHPSRARYAWPLQDFDVESYLTSRSAGARR
ncbi:DUF1643 domain-containing protein [Microbacterium panaciterrae]|uniref:DUF1643 domain-containing protein n=1 Tax=Microbacterium panaciterrae TaxID=985759 RepID=A0ABP8PWH2_9MICO